MSGITQVLEVEKKVEKKVSSMLSLNVRLRKEISKMRKMISHLSTIRRSVHPVVHRRGKGRAVTSNTIKSFRAHHGLSQKGLAELLGVSGQAIWNMEHKGGRLRLRNKTLSVFQDLRKHDEQLQKVA